MNLTGDDVFDSLDGLRSFLSKFLVRQLRAAFSQLDASPEEAAPDSADIATEIRAWRAQR